MLYVHSQTECTVDQNGKNSVINFKVSGNRLLWSVFSCLFYPKLKAINIPQETGTLDKR